LKSNSRGKVVFIILKDGCGKNKNQTRNTNLSINPSEIRIGNFHIKKLIKNLFSLKKKPFLRKQHSNEEVSSCEMGGKCLFTSCGKALIKLTTLIFGWK
jgi:hypothetical protein